MPISMPRELGHVQIRARFVFSQAAWAPTPSRGEQAHTMLPVKLFPVHGVEDRGIVHLGLPRHAFRYFPTPYRDIT
jgi:hypothetical protein